MKKIIFLFLMALFSLGTLFSQEQINQIESIRAEHLNQPTRYVNAPQQSNRAPVTIYETTHAGSFSGTITPSGDPTASSGERIVLAGTNRLITSITVDLYNAGGNLSPYDLTMSIYSECSGAGTGTPCGSGSGVLIPGSVLTQTITPIAGRYSVTFTYPNLNVYGQTDNLIAIMLHASIEDNVLVTNETVITGAHPPGEPAESLISRCGWSGANGCALSYYGISNNNYGFTIIAEADTTPPTAVCQNITASLDASGIVTILPSDINNGSSDPEGNISLSLDIDTFSCANIGSNTVVLTVTDEAGNTATCTATVTVEDTIAPAITCPSNITQDNDPGICGANVTVPIPIVTESCPSSVATVINGPNTPFIFDDSGAPFEPLLDTPSTIENVSVATSDVSLDITFSGYFYSNDNCFDLEGPDGSQVYFGCNLNVLCSEIVMVNATITEATWNSWIGSYGTDLTFVLKADPDVVDLSCGGVQEAYQLTANYNIADYNLTNDFNGTADASGFYPIGTTTVIWTTTDASGNTATCTMSVTVNDTEAPTITCPGAITQDNDPGECGAVVTYADPIANDNCTLPPTNLTGFTYLGYNQGKSFYVSENNFSGPDALTDAIANGGYVAAIEDSNQNEFLRQAVSNVGITDFVLIGFNDVASEGNFVWHDGSTVTYTNWNVGEPNNSGNEDFTLMETNTGLWNDVSTAFVIRYILQMNDSGIEQTSGLASGEIFPVGTTTNTFVVTDASGNTATCSFDVTVNDTEAPVANCAAPFTIQLDSNGIASITAADIENGSTDNCGVASTTIDMTDFDCSNVGPNTVTLTVTDVNGNSSQCTTIVTVEDSIPPAIACPADITVSTDAGFCSAIVNFPMPITSDNCGVATVVQTMGDPSGSMFPVGATTIEFTVTDVNGNTNTCSFIITVVDNEAPEAVCQNITIQLDEFGNASIVASDVDGGSTDHCGVANISIDIDTFDCSNVGDNNVVLTVTDVNGNVSTCTAIVTVEDVTAPVVACQNITVELDPVTGTVTILGTDIDNGSTDACGIASYDLDIDTFDCSNIGDNTVVLTVTDVNGNTDTCTAIVTVEDNTSPVLVCQDFTLELGADGTATLDPTDVIASNDDACGIFTVAVDITQFSCADIGTPVTVQVFSQDNNGNLSTCNAVVTVVDLLAPEITCPADQTVDPGAGNLFYIVPDYFGTGEATAIDNCTDPVTITTQDPVAGTPLSDGTYTITLTATDEYGNMATCDFELTVESVLGTGDNSQSLGSIMMYPNPAKNMLNISNPQHIDLERLEIYDLRGRLVQVSDLREMGSVKPIDVNLLAAASYYVKIIGKYGTITKRLLKE